MTSTAHRPPRWDSTAQVSLFGELSDSAAAQFLYDLRQLEPEGEDAIVEVTTPGGIAEAARRLVLELQLTRRRLKRRLVFVGKTQLYSAGVTLMSAFPREDRYLSADCVLLIHSRQLDRTIGISGPMRASLPELKALLAQMEKGVEMEKAGMSRLVEGSQVSLEEALDEALYNWYLTAPEALERGLVAGVIE